MAASLLSPAKKSDRPLAHSPSLSTSILFPAVNRALGRQGVIGLLVVGTLACGRWRIVRGGSAAATSVQRPCQQCSSTARRPPRHFCGPSSPYLNLFLLCRPLISENAGLWRRRSQSLRPRPSRPPAITAMTEVSSVTVAARLAAVNTALWSSRSSPRLLPAAAVGSASPLSDSGRLDRLSPRGCCRV